MTHKASPPTLAPPSLPFPRSKIEALIGIEEKKLKNYKAPFNDINVHFEFITYMCLSLLKWAFLSSHEA